MMGGMQTIIEVDSRLRVRTTDLPAEVVERLRVEFTHDNPMHEKLKRLGLKGPALYREPKTIASCRYDGEWMTFPRGGIGRLRAVFEEFGIARRIVDNRIDGDGPRGIPRHRVVLRDYQETIVEEAMRVQNCVVRAPTGSGKTTAMLALASRLDLPTLVIVWTGGLLDQWVRRAVAELGLTEDEVGIIGGGTHRIRPLTIGMQQSLVKHTGRIASTFGVVIADELQRFAASTFFECIDRLPARYRIGVSADERRKDRKQFLIYDAFGDIAVDIDQDDLVAQGVVHDVEVRVVPTDFTSDWYDDLQARVRDAEKRARDDDVPMSQSLVKERLLAFDKLVEDMMTDPRRAALSVELAASEVAAGEQVVMMSHRREHCRRLDADLSARHVRCGLMLGGDDDEYNRTLHALLDGSLRAAAGTYQAIGQGIDLPSVGVGVCCSPIANSRDGRSFFKQVRGRLCRRDDATGKQGARIYYLLDRAVYGLEPLRNLCRWNRRVVMRDGDEWVDAREWLKEVER
jgi:superfamily II DNA or RNA helicase